MIERLGKYIQDFPAVNLCPGFFQYIPIPHQINIAQLTEAVEYTSCISAEG